MDNENTLTEQETAQEPNTLPDELLEKDADEEGGIERLLSEDLADLEAIFPELSGIESISSLPNPTRYAALRDLGLTPREAYLATSQKKPADNRAHLKNTVPASAGKARTAMTSREWNEARALFEDLSDSEIEKLYKRVTK